VFLKSDNEPVNHRAGHPEFAGNVGNRQAIGRARQQLKHRQATVESLAGLCRHLAAPPVKFSIYSASSSRAATPDEEKHDRSSSPVTA
jgi:hypothetical protein